MPFKAPAQEEVAEYMKTKKPEWPADFVMYYAERFWNHYQASGWKLSNGNAMKDWRAAFNANWQTLKFKEDIDKLAQSHANVVKQTSTASPASKDDEIKAYINNLITAHAAGDKMKRIDVLVNVYDWLKKKGLIKLPKEVVDNIIIEAGNNRDHAKCMAVHKWFDKKISKGESL